jgi:FkbM family methyltransferase
VLDFLLGKNAANICMRRALERRMRRAYREGQIKTVYDIGAHRGKWSARWKRILPKAGFYMFEANPAMAKHLSQIGIWFLIVPLSSSKQERAFFARGTAGDSFYPETTGVYDDVPPISVTANSLDAVAAEHKIPPPDFIKIDAQGAELDILEGGVAAYGQAKFLLSELPLAQYNAGAPPIGRYLARYREAGFKPSLLCEGHNRGEGLVQIDVLFERISLRNPK